MWVRVSLVALVAACGGDGEEAPELVDARVTTTPDAAAPAPRSDAGAPGDVLLARLRAVTGITVVEQPPSGAARVFTLALEQPERHAAPAGRRFKQQLALVHVDEAAPMVLFTTGYALGGIGRRDEVAVLAGANQLTVEHRFFGTSRVEGDGADWSALDIAEAAADWHRVVTLLRPIYGGRWLTVGGSKGGAASLFHRRFYPDDVDGTVAFAAPISLGAPDPRYPAYVATRGGTAAQGCREGIARVQRQALLRRAAMQERMLASPLTFQVLGVDKALEDAVLELPFLFWMSGNAGRCVLAPAENASDADVYSFLEDTALFINFSDVGIGALAGFYVQTANQLGWPAHDEGGVADLLTQPGGDRAGAYVPHLDTEYDGGAAMRDVLEWVDREGSELLFVYGENDPWTAGAVELGGAAGRDSYKLVAPGGNAQRDARRVERGDRAIAAGAIRRWAGR